MRFSVLHPLLQRCATLQHFLWGREDNDVVGHLITRNVAARLAPPVLELLNKSPTDRGPDAPGGRRLVEFELLGNRRQGDGIVISLIDKSPDHLDSLTYRLADRCVYPLGDKVGYQLSHYPVVVEGRDHLTLIIAIAVGLVKEGVRPNQVEDGREVPT